MDQSASQGRSSLTFGMSLSGFWLTLQQGGTSKCRDSCTGVAASNCRLTCSFATCSVRSGSSLLGAKALDRARRTRRKRTERGSRALIGTLRHLKCYTDLWKLSRARNHASPGCQSLVASASFSSRWIELPLPDLYPLLFGAMSLCRCGFPLPNWCTGRAKSR